jgi:hypothetical protein
MPDLADGEPPLTQDDLVPPAQQWTTETLREDLNDRLRADRWLCANEVWLDRIGQSRADIMAVARSFSADPKAMIIELKCWRGDLLADLRAEKWRKYAKFGAVVFAFPQGLATPQEIPPEAGVLIRIPQGWSWKRSPRWAQAPRMTDRLWLRLAMTASDEALNRAVARQRSGYVNTEVVARRMRHEYARQVAMTARDLPQYRRWLEDTKQQWLMLAGEVRDLKDKKRDLELELLALKKRIEMHRLASQMAAQETSEQ